MSEAAAHRNKELRKVLARIPRLDFAPGRQGAKPESVAVESSRSEDFRRLAFQVLPAWRLCALARGQLRSPGLTFRQRLGRTEDDRGEDGAALGAAVAQHPQGAAHFRGRRADQAGQSLVFDHLLFNLLEMLGDRRVELAGPEVGLSGLLEGRHLHRDIGLAETQPTLGLLDTYGPMA